MAIPFGAFAGNGTCRRPKIGMKPAVCYYNIFCPFLPYLKQKVLAKMKAWLWEGWEREGDLGGRIYYRNF
jgi:hypothetical protein